MSVDASDPMQAFMEEHVDLLEEAADAAAEHRRSMAIVWAADAETSAAMARALAVVDKPDAIRVLGVDSHAIILDLEAMGAAVGAMGYELGDYLRGPLPVGATVALIRLGDGRAQRADFGVDPLVSSGDVMRPNAERAAFCRALMERNPSALDRAAEVAIADGQPLAILWFLPDSQAYRRALDVPEDRVTRLGSDGVVLISDFVDVRDTARGFGIVVSPSAVAPPLLDGWMAVFIVGGGQLSRMDVQITPDGTSN